MSDKVLDYLKSRKLNYKEDYSLRPHSAIGIGAVAHYFVTPANAIEFVKIIEFLHLTSTPHKVIGRLTNVLICGDVYDGVMVSTAELMGKNVAEHVVFAECGCSMPALIRYAASLGLGGAEPLATIPGSVGGCIAGNAGAFGVECSDVFLNAEVYFPAKDEIRTLTNSEMRFSYRHSLLKECDAQLVSAKLALLPKKREDVESRIAEIVTKRFASQPTGVRSLGSVFKRVNGISAGYYIDKAGLKGHRIGGAEISSKHAGFIVNRDGATSDDVLALIALAKNEVFSKFGVTLEEEIEILI